MNDFNVVIVVVTYNRLEKLKRNIKCLLTQSYKNNIILVINNNSNDGTKEYLAELTMVNDRIKAINLEQNTGGSGGFSIGIQKASQIENAKYIWGMDDDAFPENDALECIMKYANDNCALWSNCNNDYDGYNYGKKEVKKWMFVGFFIPVNIVKKVGLPRNDFFIYFDDSEYAKRILSNGYKIYKIKNSIIIHQDTSNQNIVRKKILGKEVSFFILPDWKLYYHVRNHLLMYNWNEPYKYRLILWYITKFLVKLIIFNAKQIRVFFKGYIHGILGRSGIIILP